jgi:hypothetical protein
MMGYKTQHFEQSVQLSVYKPKSLRRAQTARIITLLGLPYIPETLNLNI